MSSDERIVATIVACPLCGKRFFCDPHGNCWCKAMTQAPNDGDQLDEPCLCPSCLAERDA
jgi:hypothetical protein